MLSTPEIYKTQINLIDFVKVEYGFQINRKKSSKRQYVLNHPDTKDNIIISRNSQGQYWYFNPNNSQDKGTIIDFVLFRNSQNRDEMWAELEKFRLAQGESGDIIEIPIARSKAIFETLPLTNTIFLEKRGIRVSTIFSGEFKNRIFNHIHTVGESQFHNIAFPIYQAEETIGLELKNTQFHGYALNSEKAKGLWLSNYTHITQDQNIEWVITESAIDCLSYHQLFSSDKKTQRVYISTGGVITSGQKREIKRLTSLFSNQKIILANDNDLAGVRQNIEIMGFLHFDFKSQRIIIYPKSISHEKIELQIHIKAGKVDLQFEVESLIQVFKKDKIIQVYHIESQIKEKESAMILLHLQNSLESLIRLETIIPLIRSLKNWVEVKKPRKKDFNEDLMIELEI